MKQVPLSEVAEFINGRAFKPEDWQTEGLPIIRIQNLTGSTDTVNYYSGKVEPRYLVRNDDILISWSASLGVYKWQGGDAILNQHIFKVELKEKLIDKEYFYYAAQNALVEMESHVHGATMQHITRDPFLAIEIPLPPLTEQKRIASLLARADRLHQLRRSAHDLGDALLQSVFLEMFGDLRFPELPLSELCSFITKGTTPQSSDIKNYASDVDDVPFLKVYHLTNTGKVDFDYSPTWVSNSIHNGLLNRSKVYPNDVLMNIVGPPLGKFGILPSSHKEWNVNQAIAIFRAKKQILPIYLLHALRYPKTLEKMINQAVGIRQLNLSLEQCRDFRIPVPPLSLQEEFAGVVARVESLRGRMGESERQVNGLFESLLSQSFDGGR